MMTVNPLMVRFMSNSGWAIFDLDGDNPVCLGSGAYGQTVWAALYTG